MKALLSMAIMLVSSSQHATAQHWVDGSSNPEAVADSTAYIFLFQALIPGKTETSTTYGQRSKAYTSSLMALSEAEAELVLTAARQFQGISDSAAQERAAIQSRSTSLDASAKDQHRRLRLEFESRVLALSRSLNESLQPEAREKLASHILYIKRHSRVLKD